MIELDGGRHYIVKGNRGEIIRARI
jgi:hypothetical protein